MGRRNGEHGRTKWRNETRRGREWENLPVSTINSAGALGSGPTDAARCTERAGARPRKKLRLSKRQADSDATECAAMRCDRWFISVSAGVGRYPSPWQVPSKAAGAGGWFAQLQWRMRYWAGVLEAAGGAKSKKTREGRPMIACEMLDARKRGELLLPCVRAVPAESLKAAIELGRAGSVKINA